MAQAFICDAVRTTIGRFGGSLASIRSDDPAAFVLKALAQRNGGVDWEAVDDLILGCANQAGEDNRNVARMGMSGARLAMTSVEELGLTGGKHALATMCVGVGQGAAIVLERV